MFQPTASTIKQLDTSAVTAAVQTGPWIASSGGALICSSVQKQQGQLIFLQSCKKNAASAEYN